MSAEDQEKRVEIASLVNEAVAKFGSAGRADVGTEAVFLVGGGPTVSVDLGLLLSQWDVLPHDVRRRRCTDLARQLVAARRESTSLAPPATTPRRSLVSFAAPVGVVALTLAAGAYGWHLYRRMSAPAPAASIPGVQSAEEYEREREERAQRVCEATRSRVMQGATVGPTDVEGWVVEFAGLRAGDSADLVFDPAITAFVDRGPGKTSGRFVWASAKALVDQGGPDTEVRISDASIPNAMQPQRRGVKLTFTGRYVAPYFREQERVSYFQTAAALAERLGLTHAALYARCSGSLHPHLGAWFLGKDVGSVATALIYFAGLDADQPHVRRELYLGDGGDVDRARAFAAIDVATGMLQRPRVASVAGQVGAMISGRADGPQTVTFPFKDGSRAGRASRALAEAVGVADTR